MLIACMARHDAKWWADRLEEVTKGESARDVATRYGVREKTLIWWRSELERRSRKKPRPRLLPVVVAAEPRANLRSEAEGSMFVEIEFAGLRMSMRGAVSPEHLAAIVKASAREC